MDGKEPIILTRPAENAAAGDKIITATAAGGMVRICGAESTYTCEKARRIHRTSAVATAALGRSLTAAALLSSQLKNETDSVTFQICGKGPLGTIVCVSDIHANVRGYVHNPQVELPIRITDGKLDVGKAVGKGYLQVIKDLSLKEPYVGTSALVSGEIADDLSSYFVTSEQVPSCVALGVRVAPDPAGKEPFVVERAGGYLLQLMPGAPDSLIDDLERTISAMPSVTTLLSAGAGIRDIIEDVVRGYDPEIKTEASFGYRCRCSKERMGEALASVGRMDLEEILADGQGAELCCQFCGKKYRFTNEDIAEMLK